MSDANGYCIFQLARRTLGFGAEAWRLFVLDWAGFDDEADCYRDEPSAHRGQRRLLDRLYVAGFRSPRLMLVGPDYLNAILELKGQLGLDDREMTAVLAATGRQDVGTPLFAISGAAFQGVIAYFRARGCTIPVLSRSWMTPDRVAFLDDMRRARRVDDRGLAILLRDFGGGVRRIEDLDEPGFDRVQVALEAEAGAPASRALGRESWPVPPDNPVHRLWPEWHRPLA